SQDLLLVWEEYRRAAKRSRQLKQKVNAYRISGLLLVVTGAILGVLASQLDTLEQLSKIFAVASAILLGVAAFLSGHVLDSQYEKQWVVARSQAEALKSQAYIYLVQSSPYNGPDRDEKLSSKMQEILGEFFVEPVSLTEKEKTEKLPDNWLSMDDYLERRVNDQIRKYYEPKAIEYQQKLKLLKSLSFGLGLSGAVLGGISAADIDWSSAWVAVIGTISGAVAAFTFAGRYRYLMTSYTLTARRLKWTHNAWQRLSDSEKSQKLGTFVHKFEDVFSIENNSWVAEWTNKEDERTTERQP
ncbi:MAG: DUF4231 domain-containing protein, partial [Cyanobacteria bacterium J06555_12]